MIRQEGGRNVTLIIQLEEYIMMPDRVQNKQLVENIAINIQISWECSQNKNKTAGQVSSVSGDLGRGEI